MENYFTAIGFGKEVFWIIDYKSYQNGQNIWLIISQNLHFNIYCFIYISKNLLLSNKFKNVSIYK